MDFFETRAWFVQTGGDLYGFKNDLEQSST